MSEIRTPEPGEKVSIVLPNRTIAAEVVGNSPQLEYHSEDAPALVVKIDGALNTFPHKSKAGAPAYWEYAEEAKKDSE